MPRTPAGGRLPHGPRHVVAAVVAGGALVLTAACSAPPRTTASAAVRRSATTTTPPATPPTTTTTPPTAVPRAAPTPVAKAPAARVPSPPAPTAGARTPVPPPPRVPAPGTHRIRGVLTRIAVEPPDRPGRPGGGDVRAFVRTDDGPVEVPAPAVGHLPTGSHVVADLAAGALVAAGTTDARTAAPAAPRRAVHEVVTVLVLPPGAEPDATTSAGLRAAVDGPVSRYWQEQTGGRIAFRVSRSVGWLRVRSSCDDAWSLWAEVAARVRFAPGPRRHLVVLVPAALPGCFAGLGTIGASAEEGGFSYVRGTLPGLVAHELGHNLGLGHSNGLQCDGAADAAWTPAGWSGRCVRTAYRDWYDVMGVSWEELGTLSTAQAYRLGVLGGGVTTVTGPARVTLTAVSLHAGLRSLRVRTPAGVTYTVEYRPALGDDDWLAADRRGLRPGVLVRRDDPGGEAGQTLLLDASPSGTNAFGRDWDAPLGPGRTLTTADGRVVVRVEEETPTTATVAVQVGGRLPPSPAADLTRLGSRAAGDGSNRVVRDPAGVAATPSGHTPERARGPVTEPRR